MERDLMERDDIQTDEREKSPVSLDDIKDLIASPISAEEKAKEIYSLIAIRQESFSGPMPHPEILRQYGEMIVAAPERILTMAEKEQDNTFFILRESLEQNRVVNRANIRANTRKQYMAFILALMLIGAGLYMGIIGQTVVSCTIFGTTIASVIIAIVSGKRHTSREDKE